MNVRPQRSAVVKREFEMTTSNAPPGGQLAPVVAPTVSGNGLAVAALVVGIVGACLGVIPILAVPALICGILAVVMGLIGWHSVRRAPSRGHKGLAIAGTILGVLAIVLAIIGFITVNDAVNTLNNNLNNVNTQILMFPLAGPWLSRRVFGRRR